MGSPENKQDAMRRARLHSASVPARLCDFGIGGGESGMTIDEQVRPVPSMARAMSLTRICEDQHELLACTDSVVEDVPNWVLAMRSSSGSGKSTLFAGTRAPKTPPHCHPRHHLCHTADTAALDAEDASKSPPARPRHRRSVSLGDARAVAKASRDSLKLKLPSEPL